MVRVESEKLEVNGASRDVEYEVTGLVIRVEAGWNVPDRQASRRAGGQTSPTIDFSTECHVIDQAYVQLLDESCSTLGVNDAYPSCSC